MCIYIYILLYVYIYILLYIIIYYYISVETFMSLSRCIFRSISLSLVRRERRQDPQDQAVQGPGWQPQGRRFGFWNVT